MLQEISPNTTIGEGYLGTNLKATSLFPFHTVVCPCVWENIIVVATLQIQNGLWIHVKIQQLNL